MEKKISKIKIDPKTIVYDPNNPRKFDENDPKDIENVENQAKTYEVQGIINEPEIRDIELDGIIIHMCATGEIRIRSSIIAGMDEITVKVLEGYTEDEIRERQLIENLHLHRLKTADYEDAIVELYNSKYNKRGGQKKLAELLGIDRNDILTAIKSYEMREKHKEKFEMLNFNISTKSGYLLSTLSDDEQEKVVDLMISGKIGKNLATYIPKYKKLPEKIKDAVLDIENPINIDDAEFVLKFDEDEQEKMIDWLQEKKQSFEDMKQYKLSIAKGEIVPQIIIDNPQEELFRTIRRFVIDGVQSIRLDYLREELTPDQYLECLELVKRLLIHLKDQLGEYDIKLNYDNVIEVNAKESNLYEE